MRAAEDTVKPVGVERSELERSFDSAEAWISESEQHQLVAKLLLEKVREVRPTRGRDSNQLKVGCFNGYFLHAALAVENAAKAVLLTRRPPQVVDGKVQVGHVHGFHSHDLPALVEAALGRVAETERTVLTRLRTVVIWAGKYPWPLTVRAYQESQENNPLRLQIPRDTVVVDALLERLKQAVM